MPKNESNAYASPFMKNVDIFVLLTLLSLIPKIDAISEFENTGK